MLNGILECYIVVLFLALLMSFDDISGSRQKDSEKVSKLVDSYVHMP